jgi:hypothetical protein
MRKKQKNNKRWARTGRPLIIFFLLIFIATGILTIIGYKRLTKKKPQQGQKTKLIIAKIGMLSMKKIIN